jgi:hypothetical protein
MDGDGRACVGSLEKERERGVGPAPKLKAGLGGPRKLARRHAEQTTYENEVTISILYTNLRGRGNSGGQMRLKPVVSVTEWHVNGTNGGFHGMLWQAHGSRLGGRLCPTNHRRWASFYDKRENGRDEGGKASWGKLRAEGSGFGVKGTCYYLSIQQMAR